MEALGITEAQARAQIEVFRRASCFIRLQRPCTLQDGVRKLDEASVEKFIQLHEQASRKGRFSKFVPASGAATRMFQSLLQIYHLPQFLEPKELHSKAEYGVAVASDFIKFLDGMYYFPFVEDLEKALARDGLNLDSLLFNCQYHTILDYLLTDIGLNYGSLPKGLLKFHRYPNHCRTALEEHLVEAAGYVKDENGSCHVHFTVSPSHRDAFVRFVEKILNSYQESYSTKYEVDFSEQKPSTDTIAVDMRNRPFRDRFGKLHFRPGGHGALIENLNDLAGDLVYIKNVDNVVQDRFLGQIWHWKKVLGGCLVALEQSVHGHIRHLLTEQGKAPVYHAELFARQQLLLPFPKEYSGWSLEQKRNFLINRLDRPIRVCGVVQNVGEPGGAPFWVEAKEGESPIQIVEKAQVDFSSPEQREIWLSSTHFNPVDVVCSVRNYEGKPFNLKDFVNPEAVFITNKSKDGKDLKALELPGLWNGAMAGWLTMIVEVPRITFNPVKTVFDLLRPEHQPEDVQALF